MLKKQLLYTFIMLAVGSVFTACNDDNSIDYTVYYGWRDQNLEMSDAFMSDIENTAITAYFDSVIQSVSEPYSYPVICHVIKSANEDSLRAINRWITPFATSTLKVHYTLYDPESVYDRFEQYGVLRDHTKRNDPELMDKIFGIGYPNTFEMKADTIESYQVAYFEDFNCSSVIVGWGDALQNMHIGDTWLIQIPWFLAYGQAGSKTIPPYSNLFFRLELCDITKWGATIAE